MPVRAWTLWVIDNACIHNTSKSRCRARSNTTPIILLWALLAFVSSERKLRE